MDSNDRKQINWVQINGVRLNWIFRNIAFILPLLQAFWKSHVGRRIHYCRQESLMIYHHRCLWLVALTLELLFVFHSGPVLAGTCTNWPLGYRVDNNDYENVKKCLDEGVDPNTPNLGTPAIFDAISGRRHRITQLLIDRGADDNLIIWEGQTSLTVAAGIGDPIGIQMLLDAGADANHVAIHDSTPLSIAAASGHTDAVNKLVAAGADMEAQYSFPNLSGGPLHLAALNGHTEAVRALVANGNAITNRCQTPIFWAGYKNHVEVVDLLLQQGTWNNLVGSTSSGWWYTAVSAAQQSGSKALAEQVQRLGVVLETTPRKDCKIQQIALSIIDVEIVERDSLEPIDEISPGESFAVRLTLTKEPLTEYSEIVTIRTPDGTEQQVRVTGNSRVIVSEPILVVPADVDRGEGES